MPKMFSDESLQHFRKFCDTAGLKNPAGAFDSRPRRMARDDNETTVRPEQDKVQQLISKLGALVEGNTRNEVFKQAVDLLNQIRDGYNEVLSTHETALNAQTAAQDDEQLGAGSNGPYPPEVASGTLAKDSYFDRLARQGDAEQVATIKRLQGHLNKIGHCW